jgi:stearoyl-CoA desaturase (Delta-9 desaturase)
MKKPPIIWTNVLFFSLTFIIALCLVPWYQIQFGFTQTHWLAFAACMFFAGMSITAGYHRLWAHKAYNAHPIVQGFFALGGAFAVQNSALHWSCDHRIHHGHVDDPIKDPYAATKGFWYSHIGWMLRDYQGEKYHDYSNVRDLQRNRIVMFQHRHYLKLVLFTNLLIPLLLGLSLCDDWVGVLGMLILSGLLRLVLSQHATFFINSIAHIWGSRPYTEKNTARDNALLALFTYGEGYHNFHHIFASDYRNGVRWFDYDPTKWLIMAMTAIGLASKLKRTPIERIEKAKADTLLLKTKTRLADLPLSQDRLIILQQEYDLLLKKLQIFCSAQKKLLESKKNSMIKQCDKTKVIRHVKELEQAWYEQKQAWLNTNSKLLKP